MSCLPRPRKLIEREKGKERGDYPNVGRKYAPSYIEMDFCGVECVRGVREVCERYA